MKKLFFLTAVLFFAFCGNFVVAQSNIEDDLTKIKQEIKLIKEILEDIDIKKLNQKLDKIITEQQKQKEIISKANSTDLYDLVKAGFFLSMSSKISKIDDKVNQLLKKVK